MVGWRSVVGTQGRGRRRLLLLGTVAAVAAGITLFVAQPAAAAVEQITFRITPAFDESGNNTYCLNLASNTSVNLASCTSDSASRLWSVVPISASQSGYKFLRSGNRCITRPNNGTTIAGAACSTTDQNQHWIVEGPFSGGIILFHSRVVDHTCLRAVPDDKKLEVGGCYAEDGTFHNSLWLMAPDAASVRVVSEYSGKCWTGDDSTDGTASILQYGCVGSSDQTFSVRVSRSAGAMPKVTSVDTGLENSTIEPGRYTITRANGLCAGPSSGMSSGTALQQKTCPNNPSTWLIYPHSDYASFHIRPLADRKLAVDLSIGGGGGNDDGRKIQFYAQSISKSNQRWSFIVS